MVIWFSFSRFGILYQEKSGNPEGDDKALRSAFEMRVVKGGGFSCFQGTLWACQTSV
jgi:hypothetical protein